MSDELTPIEQEWGKRLATQPVGRCLEAVELLDLAEQGQRSKNYREQMDHILTCPVCRGHLASLRSVEMLHRSAQPQRGWLDLFRRGLRDAVPVSRRRPLLGVAVAALALVALLVGNWVVHRGAQPKVIALNDVSGRVALDAQGRLSGLPDLPVDLRAPLTVALRQGTVPTSAVLTRLNVKGWKTLQQGPFAVQGPAGTVVESSQPEFTWKLPAGAVGCKVALVPVEGTGRSLVTKMLTKTHWKPKSPLQPGRIYAWQVIALNRTGQEIARVPGRPDAARFQVLEPSRAALLARLRQATHGSHLALGVACAREGLLDEAELEFDALQRANPQSKSARELLEGVRALRAGA